LILVVNSFSITSFKGDEKRLKEFESMVDMTAAVSVGL
jgi:hypothetical protein